MCVCPLSISMSMHLSSKDHPNQSYTLTMYYLNRYYIVFFFFALLLMETYIILEQLYRKRDIPIFYGLSTNNFIVKKTRNNLTLRGVYVSYMYILNRENTQNGIDKQNRKHSKKIQCNPIKYALRCAIKVVKSD